MCSLSSTVSKHMDTYLKQMSMLHLNAFSYVFNITRS